jgi:hypothetical protein
MSNTNGVGHQLCQEEKQLIACKSSLEDALGQLGKLPHVELRQMICRAIEEAHSLACSAEDVYNDAA